MGGAEVSPFLAAWKALQCPLGKVGLLRVRAWGVGRGSTLQIADAQVAHWTGKGAHRIQPSAEQKYRVESKV